MSTAAIAKHAGVSQATVSRVINRHPGVSQEKVRLVEEAIDTLGYRPARSTRQRLNSIPRLRHGNIALLVLSHDRFQDYSSVFAKSVRGVEQAINACHLNTVKACVRTVDEIPPLILDRKIDGVILAGGGIQPEVAEAIEGIPVSWITSRKNRDGDTVLVGNEHIGRMAADYLLGRGHKELAVLNAFATSPSFALRTEFFEFTGVRKGTNVRIYDRGEPVDPEGLGDSGALDLDLVEKRVAEQADKLLADKNRPTGIFVPMDHQLAMLYRVLAKRGMQPGSDLDLIGCDDERAVLMGLYPRPATIRIDAEAIGRRAVQQLLWRISDENAESTRMRVVVEPELLLGEIKVC